MENNNDMAIRKLTVVRTHDMHVYVCDYMYKYIDIYDYIYTTTTKK